MVRKEFDKIVDNRVHAIKDTLLTKGREYSTDTDVFHNFKLSTGVSFHRTPERVGWEFMVKHITSIRDIVGKTGTDQFNFTEELVEEKIGDAINYLILIEGMLKERIRSKK